MFPVSFVPKLSKSQKSGFSNQTEKFRLMSQIAKYNTSIGKSSKLKLDQNTIKNEKLQGQALVVDLQSTMPSRAINFKQYLSPYLNDTQLAIQLPILILLNNSCSYSQILGSVNSTLSI